MYYKSGNLKSIKEINKSGIPYSKTRIYTDGDFYGNGKGRLKQEIRQTDPDSKVFIDNFWYFPGTDEIKIKEKTYDGWTMRYEYKQIKGQGKKAYLKSVSEWENGVKAKETFYDIETGKVRASYSYVQEYNEKGQLIALYNNHEDKKAGIAREKYEYYESGRLEKKIIFLDEFREPIHGTNYYETNYDFVSYLDESFYEDGTGRIKAEGRQSKRRPSGSTWFMYEYYENTDKIKIKNFRGLHNDINMQYYDRNGKVCYTHYASSFGNNHTWTSLNDAGEEIIIHEEKKHDKKIRWIYYANEDGSLDTKDENLIGIYEYDPVDGIVAEYKSDEDRENEKPSKTYTYDAEGNLIKTTNNTSSSRTSARMQEMLAKKAVEAQSMNNFNNKDTYDIKDASVKKVSVTK